LAASSLPLLEFEGREIPAIKDEVEILLLWLVLLQATLASSLDDDDIMGSVVMTSTAACGVGSSVLRKYWVPAETRLDTYKHIYV
jgi:hypothetical protein